MVTGGRADEIRAVIEPIRHLVEEVVVVDCSPSHALAATCTDVGARFVRGVLADFGAARNVALEEVTCPWVMMLDTDERMSCMAFDRLLTLAAHGSASAYRIPRYDYGGRSSWTLSRPCRLFIRSAGRRYRHPVWEEPILVPERGGLCIPTSWGTPIHHFGRLRPERTLFLRRRFDRSLVRRYSARHPAETWTLAAGAIIAAKAGDLNYALALMLQHAERTGSGHRLVVVEHARLLIAVGAYERALELLAWAAPLCGEEGYLRSRLRNISGLILARKGQWIDAALEFESAVSHGYPVSAYPLNLGVAQLRLRHSQAMPNLRMGVARHGGNLELLPGTEVSDMSVVWTADYWSDTCQELSAVVRCEDMAGLSVD